MRKGLVERSQRNSAGLSSFSHAMALFVLGFGEAFGALTDARSDEEGLLLDEERLPKRVRMRKTPTPI
jgi:hypothetical protein